MKAGDRRFLSAVLARRRRKNTSCLADQAAAHPQTAGLIQEIAHLGRHVAEAGAGAEDDCIGTGGLLGPHDRNVRKCLGAFFAPLFSRMSSGTSSGTW